MSEKRAIWNSKTGFLLAAIGSAVGLGNIWRFSYMAYENGGGAFLVPYFIALVVAGIPLIILEYALGHKIKGSAPLAFARLNKKWEWVGWWMPTVATFGILLFYSVIIGWCINYFVFAFNLSWGEDTEAFFGNFLNQSANAFVLGSVNYKIVYSTALVWIISWLICIKEVNHGIEKACLVFMPLLFILTTILVCWSLTLDGAMEGIKHYLNPDWDRINIIKHFNDRDVWQVWLSAFGQIFFTLSLGFGIMITYASYLPKKADIVGNALLTAFANCFYSFFAGFAVFGTLGFMATQKGVDVANVVEGGAGLAFIAYPTAINQLPLGGQFFGIIFFLTLVIAGFSSAVSLIEAFVCSVTDKFSWKRWKVVSGICLMGFLGSLIFTTGAGPHILGIVDHYVNHYGILVGGLLECLFVGYVLKAHVARRHVNSLEERKLHPIWDVCIKYITPLILVIIIIMAIKSDISTYREELLNPKGDHLMVAANILFGVVMILSTILVALFLGMHSWDKAKHYHTPDEEKLLT